MWPDEVIEALPFVEFGIQIDVAFVAEKLVELCLSSDHLAQMGFSISGEFGSSTV